MSKGEEREFDIDIPEEFPVATMRGAHMHFNVKLKELRGKVAPEANDEFARSIGRFEDLAHLKAELRKRLEENALDRARHQFADRIVDYAALNATIDLPDILVDQEVEVMRDEMRSAMARQGITEEAYLKATGKTEEEMREQLRRRPSRGRGACWLSPRSPKSRAWRSPTPTSRPRSLRPGLDMRTTAAWSSTSRANAAETTSGAR